MALCDCYNLKTREFYFDRSPKIFENILGLYRKGELHLTENVCPRDFIGELDYWGLSALHLGTRTRQENKLNFDKHSFRAMLRLHPPARLLAAAYRGEQQWRGGGGEPVRGDVLRQP